MGVVLILDAPRPEGISGLLVALRPLLQAHMTVAASGASLAPLRVIFYAMAPQMTTSATWERRLSAAWGPCVDSFNAPTVGVCGVRSVGKGWELVCVTVEWPATSKAPRSSYSMNF